MGKKVKVHYGLGNIPYTIITTATAMIGYNIHGSIGYAIVDFFFAPIVWIKWLIYHEVNLTIIKETFSFFFK
jgi:hypothetical protein